MIDPGDVVLFEFPRTDQKEGKLRPALVLKKTPGNYDDIWIVMISSQLDQKIENFDETVAESDSDFHNSGLKTDSVVRISRVAVVERNIIEGVIGKIDDERLNRIRTRLSDWLTE